MRLPEKGEFQMRGLRELHRESNIYLGPPKTRGFPGGSEGKMSASNAGDLGLIPGLGRFPGEGNGNPLQYSCLQKLHGQRSLVGYSPWGRKKSDMTEQLHSLQRLVGLLTAEWESIPK